MTTLERLRSLLARDLGIEAAQLHAQATLESLDIDSLRLIELLFGIEEAFGITVPADQAEIRSRVRTLGELAAYIDERLAARAEPAR